MEPKFTQKVYKITNQIPKGKVATYKQIATLAGSPGASRAVGMCMKMNPNAPHTPCHSVVASDGALYGYSGNGGIIKKKKMLKDEGVAFVDKTTVDLLTSQWKP